MPNPTTTIPVTKRVRRKRRAVKFGETPVNPVYIQRVLAGDHAADWQFDAFIDEVTDVSPLKINGVSATSIAFVEDNLVRVHYPIAIDVGQPWNYDGSPVATFANGGTLQPGSGTTEEG
jgi:hypothetical protein